MPRIREYTTQTSAEAGIPGRRAQGSDFGGPGLMQIGQSMQGAGQDMANGALYLKQQEGREEVTDVHTQLAEANAKWTLHLNDRGNATAPGDNTFADKFVTDFDDYTSKLGDKYTTAKGKRAFEEGVGQLRALIFIASTRCASTSCPRMPTSAERSSMTRLSASRYSSQRPDCSCRNAN